MSANHSGYIWCAVSSFLCVLVFICPGPPVGVGMNIDIASIDMVSEVNMVSRPLSPLLLGQCVTIVIAVMLKPVVGDAHHRLCERARSNQWAWVWDFKATDHCVSWHELNLFGAFKLTGIDGRLVFGLLSWLQPHFLSKKAAQPSITNLTQSIVLGNKVQSAYMARTCSVLPSILREVLILTKVSTLTRFSETSFLTSLSKLGFC